MTTFIPKYKHDIFVSYAHEDDLPPKVEQEGWVTRLVNGLKFNLGQKLGRSDAYSLWFDRKSDEKGIRSSELVEYLKKSAILLMILSHAYLESKQCQSELKAFLDNVDNPKRRVYIIEKEFLERPAEISKLMGIQFWTGHPPKTLANEPDSEELEYYYKLNDLAFELTNRLKLLKIDIDMAIASEMITRRVFLAQVTEDLEYSREEIKECLRAQKTEIYPQESYSFATNIQEVIDRGLDRCGLFVQLLSQQQGFGLPRLQYERARRAKLQIMQWRDSRVDIESIHDDDHKNLLEGAGIKTTTLQEFKEELINTLKQRGENKHGTIEGKDFVFINAVPEDLSEAKEIKEDLGAHGIKCVLPMQKFPDIKIVERRLSVEHNLLNCDAVILIYGKAPLEWMREQLLYCKRMKGWRDHDWKVIAVLNNTLQHKPSPLHLEGLQLFESQLQNEAWITTFINLLKENK